MVQSSKTLARSKSAMTEGRLTSGMETFGSLQSGGDLSSATGCVESGREVSGARGAGSALVGRPFFKWPCGGALSTLSRARVRIPKSLTLTGLGGGGGLHQHLATSGLMSSSAPDPNDGHDDGAKVSGRDGGVHWRARGCRRSLAIRVLGMVVSEDCRRSSVHSSGSRRLGPTRPRRFSPNELVAPSGGATDPSDPADNPLPCLCTSSTRRRSGSLDAPRRGSNGHSACFVDLTQPDYSNSDPPPGAYRRPLCLADASRLRAERGTLARVDLDNSPRTDQFFF